RPMATIAMDRDQSFRLQPLQRLAHRRPRDVEHRGQPLLGQPDVRREVADEEPRLQLAVRAIALRRSTARPADASSLSCRDPFPPPTHCRATIWIVCFDSVYSAACKCERPLTDPRRRVPG